MCSDSSRVTMIVYIVIVLFITLSLIAFLITDFSRRHLRMIGSRYLKPRSTQLRRQMFMFSDGQPPQFRLHPQRSIVGPSLLHTNSPSLTRPSLPHAHSPSLTVSTPFSHSPKLIHSKTHSSTTAPNISLSNPLFPSIAVPSSQTHPTSTKRINGLPRILVSGVNNAAFAVDDDVTDAGEFYEVTDTASANQHPHVVGHELSPVIRL